MITARRLPQQEGVGVSSKGKEMEIVEKAIEIQATIDKSRQLILDEELPVTGPMRVKVIILLGEETDIDEREWLAAGASNEAFEFLKDPAEDIYTLTDGKPLGE